MGHPVKWDNGKNKNRKENQENEYRFSVYSQELWKMDIRVHYIDSYISRNSRRHTHTHTHTLTHVYFVSVLRISRTLEASHVCWLGEHDRLWPLITANETESTMGWKYKMTTHLTNTCTDQPCILLPAVIQSNQDEEIPKCAHKSACIRSNQSFHYAVSFVLI